MARPKPKPKPKLRRSASERLRASGRRSEEARERKRGWLRARAGVECAWERRRRVQLTVGLSKERNRKMMKAKVRAM